MAEQDELNVDGPTDELDVDVDVDVDDSEDIAIEPIETALEPVDVYLNEKNAAISEFKLQIIDNLEMQDLLTGSDRTQAERLEEAEKITGNIPIVVGDKPGEGLIPGSYVSAFSRIHPTYGTIPVYQAAEQQSLEGQSDNLFSRSWDFFNGEVDKSLLPTPEQLYLQGITDKEGNFYDPEGQKQLFGVEITNERLENFVKLATTASTLYGAVSKGIAGAPAGPAGVVGGATMGGLLSGSAGLGLSSLATVVIDALAYVPGDRSKMDVLTDLAKRGYTNFGLADDFADLYLITSDAIRNEMVANVVQTADVLGVKKATKLLDEYGIVDFEGLKKQTKESFDAHEAELNQKVYGETPPPSVTGPMGLFSVLFLNPIIKDKFLLGLSEVKAEILEDSEYRDARAKVRQDALIKTQVDLKVQSRNLKPTEKDRSLITPYELYKLGRRTKEELSNHVQQAIKQISYAELHPDLRKEQPDVDLWKQVVSTIPKDHPLMKSDADPNLFAAIESVHMQQSDDQIQATLNTVPFGILSSQYLFEEIVSKSIPSQKEIDRWAASMVITLEGTGSRASRSLEESAFRIFMKKADDPQYGTYFKRSLIGEVLNWAGVVTTGAAETEISLTDNYDELLKPLFESMGLPNGIYVPTPAGLDKMLQRGIRNPDADFLTRFDARMDQALGGFQIGYAEIAASYGWTPDDIQYNLLQNLGMFLDMFLNLEKSAMKGAGKTGRTVLNTRHAANVLKTAPAGQKVALAKEALLTGVVDYGSNDPLIRVNTLIRAGLTDRKNQGLRNFKSLSAAEKEIVRRILLLTERDPEKYIAADILSSNDTAAIQKVAKHLINEIGDSEVVIFRNDGSYKRIERQVQDLVDNDLFTVDDKHRFMAMIEMQAFKIAEQPDSPFQTPSQVIHSLRVEFNRAAGATARFMGKAPDDVEVSPTKPKKVTGVSETPEVDVGEITLKLVDKADDPDIRFARQNDIPTGYFEYNPTTKSSIINLFSNGDIDTLWHENGHFMAALMGEQWNQKIKQFFDHTVDNNGVKRMSDLGHEQFAEAWRYYRRVKDASNGTLRRLFDELWIGLHNIYSRIRKKPGLLPKKVREFWDLEFGTLPADRRSINALVSGVTRKRPQVILVDGDARERVRTSKPARTARKQVAQEPSMNPTVLHQYLGDKFVTKIDVVKDPVTGALQRVPRRVYAATTDDPIDVLNKVIAYVKTDRYRKQISKTKTVQVGTGKYIVPVGRQKIIHETVLKRLIDALGSMPTDLAKRLFQRSPDGYVRRDNLPDFVNQGDLNAFDARQRMRHSGPRRLTDETIKTTEFFVLNDREQAGMKTLLQEISQQPASDVLPISILDPEANLRILAHDEYDFIIKIMQDIEAGPLNRSSRGVVHPGLFRSLGSYLSRKEISKSLGDRIGKLADLFTREKLRFNKKNAHPELVDSFEKFIRLLKKAPEDLGNEIETARKKGVDYFINFYKNQVSLFVPLVDLSKVDRLFRIVGVFNELKTGMNADAFAKQRAQQQLTGVPSRMVPDIVASSGGPGSLDMNFLFNSLVDIQDLLDGPHGMTRLERTALIELRTLKKKYDNNQALSDIDNHAAADAIQVLHNGLLEKYEYVHQTTMDVFKLAIGVDGDRVNWSFTEAEILRLYKSYYTGDLMEMYDIAQSHSLIPLDPDAAKTLFGDTVSTQDIDAVALLTNVLVYGKMSELRRGFAKELAEKGYKINRRSLFETMALDVDLGEVPGLDRQKYLERVTFYINEELGFQSKVVIDRITGKVKASPKSAPKELYGASEVQPSVKDHPDKNVITQMDKSAKDEASRILDMLGIRRELGTFNTLRLGDETLLLPENLIMGLEEAFSENLKMPYKFKRNFGRTGSIEYSLLDDMPTLPVSVWRSVKDAAETLYTISPHKVFYSGLLIGSGGFPMVPYMFGVFGGTLSQIQLGQGVLAATKDAAAFPGTMTGAIRSYNNLKEVNFISGVLARTFGEGNHKPITKPYILKDGRILTADGLAKAITEEGVKGAFIGVLSNTNVHDRVLTAFSKSNAWVGGSVIGGTLGGILGLIGGGPVGLAAGATAGSAIGGATVGSFLKRGNWFSKTSRYYSEASTAIDTYFRLRAIVREMDENGSTIQQAAKKVRDVVLDYSDMSDFEKKWFQQAFAFYVYFKQATKLLVQSLIENPDRVLTQLKIARASQLAATDLEDPELALAPWDRTRTFIPWKIGDHAIRLPYLITADVVSLISDIVGSIPTILGPQAAEQSRRNLLQRANPFAVETYKMAFGQDPRGFEISRTKKQVPALIVQLDLDIFGGVLHDKLGITYIPYSDIKTSYADKDPNERISTKNLEMPGRGMWVSTKPAYANFLLDFYQTPISGRMLDLIEAIDRSNIGLTEAIVRASDAYYQKDKKRPLLARVPGLVELGVVKAERNLGQQYINKGVKPVKVYVARPTDAFDPDIAPGTQGYLDTATAHRAMREDFSYEGTDGLNYKLRYKDFYPLYLLKVIGLSPVFAGDTERQTVHHVKKHLREVQELKKPTE